MITTTYDLLTAHPFLSGLADDRLDRLSRWGARSLFHPGARIFSEGGRAERFWLVREGRVALDIEVPGRGKVLIETLGAGTVLGWSWLFPPYRWHLGATAVSQTLTVAFDAAGVRRLCEEDAELGAELYRRFMAVVADRLQATRRRLVDLSGIPA